MIIINKILKLFAALLLTLSIISCSGGSSNGEIVGTYVSDIDGSMITFNADGTGTTGTEYFEMPITWKAKGSSGTMMVEGLEELIKLAGYDGIPFTYSEDSISVHEIDGSEPTTYYRK